MTFFLLNSWLPAAAERCSREGTCLNPQAAGQNNIIWASTRQENGWRKGSSYNQILWVSVCLFVVSLCTALARCALVYPCSYCLYFSSDWAPRVSISYKIAFVVGISDEYKMKFKGGRLARKSLSSQKRVRPQLYHPTMVNFCLEELHLRRILFFLVQKQSSYPPLWKCYPKCC